MQIPLDAPRPPLKPRTDGSHLTEPPAPWAAAADHRDLRRLMMTLDVSGPAPAPAPPAPLPAPRRPDGTPLATWQADARPVRPGARWDADGGLTFVAAAGPIRRAWPARQAVETAMDIFSLEPPLGEAPASAFAWAGADRLAGGNVGGALRVDGPDGAPISTTIQVGPIAALAAAPDGDILAYLTTTGVAGSLALSTHAGCRLRVDARAIAWQPVAGQRRLAVAGGLVGLCVYDLSRPGIDPQTFAEPGAEPARWLAWSSSGHFLAAQHASGGCTVHADDFLQQWELPDADPATRCAWSPVADVLAVGDREAGVTLLAAEDTGTTASAHTTVMAAARGCRATAMAWAPDGASLTVATAAGSLLRLAWPATDVAEVLAEGCGTIDEMAWSADGQRLALQQPGGLLRVLAWNAAA